MSTSALSPTLFADKPATNGARVHWRSWGSSPEQAAGQVAAGLLKGQGAHLLDRSVAVFGLGAVGGRSWLLLARLGVGSLLGMDPDTYGADSWRTQPALPEEAGRPKARLLGELAHRTNPGIFVRTGQGLAQSVPLALVRRADVILAAGDNIELIVWAGNLAAALGKPLIQGAVFGPTLTALVRGFDLRNSKSVCPACALTKGEWTRLASRFGCDPQTARAQGMEATQTRPDVCAMAADILVAEAVKYLEGGKHALAGEELAYCLLTHKVWRTRLARNLRCRCPHRRWRIVELADDPGSITLGQLVAEMGIERAQVRAESPWCSFSVCSSCGRQIPVRRFAHLGESVGVCPCGQALETLPLGMRSVVPGADLNYVWDEPLTHLGLGPGGAVGSADEEGWTYFVLPGDPVIETGTC